MGSLTGFLIFAAVVGTLWFFVKGVQKYRNNEEYHNHWRKALVLFIIMCALTVLLPIASVGFSFNDMALLLWLFITPAMIVFIILGGMSWNSKEKRSRNFKRAAIAFSVGLVCFIVAVGTSSNTESDTNELAAADEETVEELSEEPTEETTTEAEKEAAEKKAEEEAEQEKEESIEEEKEAEEKEESIEEAKKEEEASIEEEKKKEESIEAEKEESIEKEEQEEESTEEEPEEESTAPKDGLIPVDLYRVVDGDTVNVIDDSGKELDLRLLLIDTPETVHPSKPVEPYGEEASARLTDLLNNADQLYIEYDSGEKTDHYDRHLVYLYADDENVHEKLLEEGLARVGYIYEQQKYLSDFREAEQHAKDNQLGIWSIPGYVNEGGEGFNSEDEESEPESTSEPETSEPESTEQPAQSESFENCDDLRGTHPSGVEEGHPAYQSKMDRDKDGWACEVS